MNLLGMLSGYLFILNLAGLLAMGVDKYRAKRHAWRIPEANLFLVSLLGGSIGTWAGMYLFRHKIKHRRFVILMPLICIVHVFLAVYVFYRLFG